MSILESLLKHSGKLVYGVSTFKNFNNTAVNPSTINESSHPTFAFFDCENSKVENYYCKRCPFQTNLLIILQKHVLKFHTFELQSEESVSELEYYTVENYVCEKCNFHTHSGLKWLQHAPTCSKNGESFSEDSYEDNLFKFTEVYTMNVYSKAKRPRKGVTWHRCDQCNYKAKIKTHLTHH